MALLLSLLLEIREEAFIVVLQTLSQNFSERFSTELDIRNCMIYNASEERSKMIEE